MNTQDLWVDEANTEAVRRMAAAQPALVDIRLAGEVLPNLDGQVVLHAGPPIPYARMCPPMRSAVQAAARVRRLGSRYYSADELLGSCGVGLPHVIRGGPSAP
jgi:hypothetical protein